MKHTAPHGRGLGVSQITALTGGVEKSPLLFVMLLCLCAL